MWMEHCPSGHMQEPGGKEIETWMESRRVFLTISLSMEASRVTEIRVRDLEEVSGSVLSDGSS